MADNVRKTRTMLKCLDPVFGEPNQLTSDYRVLPTYEDVIKHYLWIQNNLKCDNWNREPTVSEISRNVAVAVKSIWFRASIPTVSDTRIRKMVRDFHDKCQNLKKIIKARKNNPSFNIKLQKFRQSAMKLFDVSYCKCKDFLLCKCSKTFHVPEQERIFLKDQREKG